MINVDIPVGGGRKGKYLHKYIILYINVDNVDIPVGGGRKGKYLHKIHNSLYKCR